MDPDNTNREKIAFDQIQRLTAQGIPGIGATALCSVILAVALYGVSPKSRLLFWIGTFPAAGRLNREIYHFLMLKYENIGLIGHLEKEIKARKKDGKRIRIPKSTHRIPINPLACWPVGLLAMISRMDSPRQDP